MGLDAQQSDKSSGVAKGIVPSWARLHSDVMLKRVGVSTADNTNPGLQL
jgi:hypothetical protein